MPQRHDSFFGLASMWREPMSVTAGTSRFRGARGKARNQRVASVADSIEANQPLHLSKDPSLPINTHS